VNGKMTPDDQSRREDSMVVATVENSGLF